MAKYYRFEPWMLNGHPANVSFACRRIIVRAVNQGLVVTSTSDGAHAPTSFHYTKPRAKAVDLGHAPDVSAEEGRRRKVAFQHWLLAQGEDKFTELFGPDNDACVKDGQRISLVEGTPLETNHDTHVHVTPRTRLGLPLRPQPAPARVPAAKRQLSDKGLDLIARFEGLRLTAYKPVQAERFWTIGYGHTGPDVKQGMTITQARALELLREDSRAAQDAVRSAVRVPLTQGEFDALTSFAFNVGGGALSSSTLLRELNVGHRKAAADQFKRWNRGADGRVLLGLTRRRRAERRMFLRVAK